MFGSTNNRQVATWANPRILALPHVGRAALRANPANPAGGKSPHLAHVASYRKLRKWWVRQVTANRAVRAWQITANRTIRACGKLLQIARFANRTRIFIYRATVDGISM